MSKPWQPYAFHILDSVAKIRRITERGDIRQDDIFYNVGSIISTGIYLLVAFLADAASANNPSATIPNDTFKLLSSAMKPITAGPANNPA